MSLRTEKINSAIQQRISDIIHRELSLKPGVFITISKVDTTPDMRYTRIFVSVFPFDQLPYVEATLKKELHRLQGFLNKQMHSKILPRIEFRFENTQEKVSQLDQLFEEIRRENEND